MAVPLAITGMLTFYVPDLGPQGKLVYAYITYTLVMTAYTAINIPYGALMGVITPSSLERTSVSTYRFVAAFIGGIIVQSFTLSLVNWFGQTDQLTADGQPLVDQQTGFFWTVAVYSLAAVVLFFVTFALTRERVKPAVETAANFRADLRFLLTSLKLHQIFLVGLALLAAFPVGFAPDKLVWIAACYLLLSTISWLTAALARQRMPATSGASSLENDFNDLITNRPWLVLFFFGLFQLIAAFLRGGATLYYFKYFVKDDSWSSTFLVAGSLAAIAGMLLTRQLTALLGKRALMIAMNTGTAICTALLFLVEPSQTWLMLGLQIVGGFISGPSPVLLWAMYADVADYSEWRFHRRATGLVFSAATFSQNLGCAIGAAMTGWVLGWIGYQEPVDGVAVEQTAQTLVGLQLMMSLLPAGFLLAAAGCLLFYEITPAVAHQMEADLRSRRVSPQSSPGGGE
jgi:GPH family glycoside/pentoside/hexuronide:cation symporter